MLTEETIQNWTRPRGESPSQTPSSAAVRRGAKRFQNGVEKISTLTEAVEDMTPGSSPYANISPGMEFIDNILTGIGATSEMVKHPGAERMYRRRGDPGGDPVPAGGGLYRREQASHY